MKRFILFAGDIYYPSGGADDLIDSFDSKVAAHEHYLSLRGSDDWGRYQWANILDTETGEVIHL